MINLRNKLSYAVYTLLVLVFLVGCSELDPNTETFVVIEMKSYDELYRYKLLPTEGSGILYINSKYFYKVGDTLTLKLN